MKKMKTLRNLMLAVIVLTAFSLSTQAQWAVNGADIYNTNVGNVGIGITTPLYKLQVNRDNDYSDLFVTRPYAISGGDNPIGTIRIMNSTTSDAFNMSLRYRNGAHEMIQSAYSSTIGGGKWLAFSYLNLSTGKYEMRNGITDFEYKNTGDILFHNDGGLAMGSSTIPDGHRLNVQNYTAGKAAVQGLDQNYSTTYAIGMLGVLQPGDLGVPMMVFNAGVLGIKPNNGNNGAAVYGWNNDDHSENYAGLFYADGVATTTGYTNYGIYANAQHADSNIAGKFEGRVVIDGHPDAATAADYLISPLTGRHNHNVADDSPAIDAYANNTPGYGKGIRATGGYMGVHGIADATSYNGYAYGVYGDATGTAGVRIGIYGTASGGTTNWAGYFAGDAYISSDLRIGTKTQATGYSLSVNGKIACEEVLVKDDSNWPDYVFGKDYDLMSLKQLEKSIEKNNHLPGLPAAAEVEEEGFKLADMQRRVLEKVEELTLYTIEQGKLIQELQKKVEILEKENNKLKKAIK